MFLFVADELNRIAQILTQNIKKCENVRVPFTIHLDIRAELSAAGAPPNQIVLNAMIGYYSIQELKREFGVTARTLRYYEDVKLMQPVRQGRARLYTGKDRNRLRQIMRAKRLNFSLAEIAELISIHETRPEGEDAIHKTIAKIEEKRAMLKQMRRDIDETLRGLYQIDEICIQRLAELRVNR